MTSIVTTTLDSVSKLCVEYQITLKAEVDALTETQALIDGAMKEADRLTTQALKVTKIRTERLDVEATGLKGGTYTNSPVAHARSHIHSVCIGTRVDALAEAAEATHTTLTSIITTLLAIDEMLPAQERLSLLTSAHKGHYPKLHTLLADKAHQIELRFRNVRSPELRPQTRSLTMEILSLDAHVENLGESSSMWSHRRRLSSATLLDSPVTFSHHARGASSPHLQLRTILPSPSSGVSKSVSASGSYFPIAPRIATGVSLASPLYSSAERASVESRPPGKGSSGIWSRRASTSTLAALVASERAGGGRGGGGSDPSPVMSKAPSTWRHSAGSWAGFFGGKSSRGSSGVGGESRASAEERLKKLLEGHGAGTGKGKGKGVIGR